jgi:sugar-phosphatase
MKDVPNLATIAAVLFDMDGTLVDSDAAVERAWAAWAREYGVDAAAALANVHNGPAERTVRVLLPRAEEARVAIAAQRQLALQYDDLSDVVAAPGAVRLLEILHRWAMPWAVVTSADTKLATARLDAAGIDPPVLVTSDDVVHGKPDPEGYLLGARRLGVEASRCLVVEDSEPGLAAGRAAGAMTAGLRGLRGDLPLRDLTQLTDLLEDALSDRPVPRIATPAQARSTHTSRWSEVANGSMVTRRISSSSGVGQNTPESRTSKSSDGST